MITIDDVVSIPDAVLTQPGPRTFTAPHFDSRKLGPGTLFFALGGRRDGVVIVHREGALHREIYPFAVLVKTPARLGKPIGEGDI